ncbi:DMT family transporter [Terrilactibacillus laevilacticus]|uniref:EamA family transporter n=1 Tax=Terrilactibacillus laevilacticus TaxID=1380157 RepID=A0ABW5PTW1_9BACI|nr:DMT family transporter [Terrilactibacillus laevilacticus]
MGVIFSLLNAVLFSLGNVYNRKTDKKFTGLEAMALNIGLLAIFFFPLSLMIKIMQGTPWPDVKTILLYALVGIIHSFFARWGLFNTIRYIGPSRASMIKNSAPAFTVILAFIFMDQRPTAIALIGILIILCAIWTLGWQERASDSEVKSLGETSTFTSWHKGIALGVLVAFLFASADIIRAMSMQRGPDVILATGISSMAAWITLVLFLLKEGKLIATYHKHLQSLDKNLVLATLFWGLAIITYFIAVKYLLVAYVSALIATGPIMTAFFSYLLARNDERFTKVFWICTFLMIVGAILIVFFQ